MTRNRFAGLDFAIQFKIENLVQMIPIFYDLTELYLRSRGKIKYYGIARVVAEIAFEIPKLNPDVRFVVFDSTRHCFFEILPVFGEASDNGVINLGLPQRGIPLRVRESSPKSTNLSRSFRVLVKKVAGVVNTLMFPDIAKYLKPVTLQEGYLFSAARPKFIADIADFLRESGSAVKLHAMIYDMIPLDENLPVPARFKANFIHDNRRILNQAAMAVSISHYTDIALGEAAEKGILPKPAAQCVVQLCHECREDGEVADIVLPESPYFLGVGITMGRKNFDVVLGALSYLMKQGKAVPLFVVAGVDRNRNREALQVGKYAALEPYVHFVPAPAQANLVKLYQNALATVMASKLEGWGLPLGESLWFGTPGISSPYSSLPEVGGDLAVYFNPDDPEELAGIFERMMSDNAYYDDLKLRIKLGHSKLRTWADVADGVIESMTEKTKT